MKRRDPDPRHFSLLRKLDVFARTKGLSIDDADVADRLLAEFSQALNEHRTNPMRLHGFRTEAMFAHIAAALGQTVLINEEDSGIFFVTDGNIRGPDFRLVLKDKQQLLVEVKNFHPKDPSSPYILDRDYLNSLTSYAELVGLPLKIAIYWSHPNLWTLIDSRRIDARCKKIEIPLERAIEANEMVELGDCMFGAALPLALRLYADQSKPREIGESGEVQFTIGSAVLMAQGTEITDELEQKLAFFLLNYGQWDESDQPVTITDGKLDYFELAFSKTQMKGSEDFTIIGFVSQMLSRQYQGATSPDEVIRLLIPTMEATDMGVAIPASFKGKALRLWRFSVRPKPEATSND